MRTHAIQIGAMLGTLCAAAALAGCADLTRATASLAPAALNVESPVAPAVLAAQTQPLRSPTFRDVPPLVATSELRSPLQWSRTVQALNRDGTEINVWAQENPSLAPNTTAAFNAAALKELKYSAADLPPEDQATRSEGYANRLRTEAAPPPAPK